MFDKKKRINKLKIKIMPIPTPTTTEGKDEFIVRCMSDDKMTSEYPDTNQRYAVCIATYQENK